MSDWLAVTPAAGDAAIDRDHVTCLRVDDVLVGPSCENRGMRTPPAGAPRWADPDRGVPETLEVHEAVFEAPDGRRMRLVAASREALIAMGAQADEHAGHLRPLESGEVPSSREFDEAVSHEVGVLRDGICQGG